MLLNLRWWVQLLLVMMLVLARSTVASAQDPTLTATVEFRTDQRVVVDTLSTHFADFWMMANAELLRPEATVSIARGQSRLSLRSMENPSAPGHDLISHDAVDQLVSPATLLCANSSQGVFQLRCRPDALHPDGRRVRLDGTRCGGVPTLQSLLPEGCRPYVVTIEGRTAHVPVVRRLVHAPEPSAPNPVGDEPPPAWATELTRQVAALQDRITDLQQQAPRASRLQRERDELRRKNEQQRLWLWILGIVATVSSIIFLTYRSLYNRVALRFSWKERAYAELKRATQDFIDPKKFVHEDVAKYLAIVAEGLARVRQNTEAPLTKEDVQAAVTAALRDPVPSQPVHDSGDEAGVTKPDERISGLQAALQQVQDELRTADDELNTARVAHSMLAEGHEQLRTSHGELSRRAASLEASVSGLEQAADQLRIERDEYKRSLEGARADAELQRQIVNRLTEERSDGPPDIAHAYATIRELRDLLAKTYGVLGKHGIDIEHPRLSAPSPAADPHKKTVIPPKGEYNPRKISGHPTPAEGHPAPEPGSRTQPHGTYAAPTSDPLEEAPPFPRPGAVPKEFLTSAPVPNPDPSLAGVGGANETAKYEVPRQGEGPPGVGKLAPADTDDGPRPTLPHTPIASIAGQAQIVQEDSWAALAPEAAPPSPQEASSSSDSGEEVVDITADAVLESSGARPMPQPPTDSATALDANVADFFGPALPPEAVVHNPEVTAGLHNLQDLLQGVENDAAASPPQTGPASEPSIVVDQAILAPNAGTPADAPILRDSWGNRHLTSTMRAPTVQAHTGKPRTDN